MGWSINRGTPLLALAEALLGREVGAEACSLSEPEVHRVDPAERELDSRPPGTPRVRLTGVGRASEELRGTSCEGLAGFGLAVEAEDDRTNPSRLGWEIQIVDGAFPGELPPAPTRSLEGMLGFSWYEKLGDDTAPFAVTLRVRAIDLAGNRGQFADVTVRDPGFPHSKQYENVQDAERSCRARDAEGCVWAGKMFVHGLEVAQDVPRGQSFYRRGCDLDHAYACEMTMDTLRAAYLKMNPDRVPPWCATLWKVRWYGLLLAIGSVLSFLIIRAHKRA